MYCSRTEELCSILNSFLQDFIVKGTFADILQNDALKKNDAVEVKIYIAPLQSL